MPSERCFRVEFLGQEQPESVFVNGTSFDKWSYDETTKTITVPIPRTSCATSTTIEIKSQEIAAIDLTPNKVDTDFTNDIQQQITSPQYWITGSAVPGGTQKLMTFPNSQYKFAGILNVLSKSSIHNKPRSVQLILYPPAKDANIVSEQTPLVSSTVGPTNDWNVSFADAVINSPSTPP